MACRTARALLRLLHFHPPASLQAMVQPGLWSHQAASMTNLHLFCAGGIPASQRSFASQHLLPADQQYEYVCLNNIAPAPGATKPVRCGVHQPAHTHSTRADTEKAAGSWVRYGSWEDIRTWAQGTKSPIWCDVGWPRLRRYHEAPLLAHQVGAQSTALRVVKPRCACACPRLAPLTGACVHNNTQPIHRHPPTSQVCHALRATCRWPLGQVDQAGAPALGRAHHDAHAAPEPRDWQKG